MPNEEDKSLLEKFLRRYGDRDRITYGEPPNEHITAGIEDQNKSPFSAESPRKVTNGGIFGNHSHSPAENCNTDRFTG